MLINRTKILSGSLLLAILLLILGGCSTRKNTFTRRVFHNVTAQYNAYFNGEQALKQGVKQIHEAHTDNFEEILPVFRLADEAASQSVAPHMDRAVKKAAKVVQKHSMEFRGKEYNNWIDDAYLLMGQAQFYKQEYMLSKRLFNFVISKYHRHDQVYEAMIWKAHVDVIRGNYEQALNSLEQVKYYDRRGKVDKESQRRYPRVFAQLYIDVDNYDKAVFWLDKAIKESNNKDERTRMMFIKAQIFQKNKQFAKAKEAFKTVIKKNPSYELTFYSKIYIAKSYQSDDNDNYDIKPELKEMLKDAKNKEYKGVIYYALATIAMEEEKQELGIEYLRKSVSNSVNDNRQKAVSALELGELYFDRKHYELSQAYYDSAMLFLPKTYPDFEKLNQKHKVLSGLVDNLIKVQMQDSLQKVAGMSPQERDRFINDLITKVMQDEQKQRQEEQMRLAAARESQMNTFRNQQLGGSGEWYFYNNQSKSFGFTEFRQRWGERKLEDNWRLKEKSTGAFEEGMGGEMNDSLMQEEAENQELTYKDKEYYLQGLPLTPEALAISDSIIKQALFDLGLIYQEGLKDYEKAVESHERLIKRYPDSKFTLNAYFHLYNNHEKIGNSEKSKEYKQLILKNYPESDYAKFIQDPEYFKKQNKSISEAEEYYSKAWEEYAAGNYREVVTLADTGISSYEDTEATARLALLKAFAQGHIADSATYVQSLAYVANEFKGTKPATTATEMINALSRDAGKGETTGGSTANPGAGTDELYTYEPDEMQLYIAVFNMEGLSINKVKIAYSNFNKEFFSLKDLSVNSVYLDNKRQMLTISRFSNAKEALKYHSAIKNNPELKKYFSGRNSDDFVLSVNDYSKFYKDKNMEKYLEFFKENYLNEEE